MKPLITIATGNGPTPAAPGDVRWRDPRITARQVSRRAFGWQSTTAQVRKVIDEAARPEIARTRGRPAQSTARAKRPGSGPTGRRTGRPQWPGPWRSSGRSRWPVPGCHGGAAGDCMARCRGQGRRGMPIEICRACDAIGSSGRSKWKQAGGGLVSRPGYTRYRQPALACSNRPVGCFANSRGNLRVLATRRGGTALWGQGTGTIIIGLTCWGIVGCCRTQGSRSGLLGAW